MTKSLKEVLQMHRAASLKGKYEDRSKQINVVKEKLTIIKGMYLFIRWVGQRKSAGSSDFCRIPTDFLL